MQTEDQLKQRNKELKNNNLFPAGAGNSFGRQALPVPAGPAHHFGPSPPKRSRPENAEHEETSSTEQQPFITQREDDQQQEDHRSSPENYIFKEISLEKHDLFKKWPNVQLSSIKNTSNLHPVTSTTASAQDSQAANVSPNNNSLDDFTYQTGTFTLSLTERLNQSKDGNKKKTDLFIGIMKLYSKLEKLSIPAVEAGERLQSLLEEYQKKQSREEKQYAFGILFLKDRKAVIFGLFYPRSEKRDRSDSIITDTLHSEQILIETLDTFLKNNGTNVQDVFIYTYNSPCTKREEEHIETCMSLLRRKADQWHNEYGFFTAVAFKAFWGQTHPDNFNYLEYSYISSSQFFKMCIEKCDNIPFRLYSKCFNKLDPEEFKNNDIKSGVKKLKELAKSTGLKKDLLERGEEIIVHLENLQDQEIGKKCEIWRKKLHEMVNNSFMSPIRKAIYRDFNAAVVHLAVEDLQLGNNSPLQLYHILDRNQNMLT